MTGDFIWHMEDVLDVYEQPYDPEQPVICFDERPCQLIGDVISPIPMKPGSTKKEHYEYSRNGTGHVASLWRLNLVQAGGWLVLRNIGPKWIMLIL
jgi:hypothetical protein